VDLGGDILDILVLRATQPTSDLNASLSIISALDTMRTDYDCIVVDFSASEQSADMEAGANVVNEIVVVAEARRSTTDMLAGVLRKLPADKVACIVLNKV
jgi:MinD-like ATPase involved in chromosome partitioning or flagellar assembly